VITLLLAFYLGYTKFCCFSGNGTAEHGKVINEKKMTTLTSIDFRAKMSPVILWLIQKKFSCHHCVIKLGLMKSFIKSVVQNGSGFLNLKQISKDQQGQNQGRNMCGPTD
jgi:hypothetical protein